jgi:hypothetical protein
MHGEIYVNRRETINPYRYAIGTVVDALVEASNEVVGRLAWDLNPLSRTSRARMLSWKNRYAGQKAVILCNGPSLLKVDFPLLQGTFTFGLNKINLLFNKSEFRPSCIVAVNSYVLEQNHTFYNETDIPLFLDSAATACVTDKPSIAFLHSARQRKFARDCSRSIYQGYTVTFVALQLAYHMGFNSVALVGCDHTFTTKGPANKAVVSGEMDSDHFDPNYFSGGVKWQLPDLLQSEISYTMAREVFEASGRRIVNATTGGKLEVFERLTLEGFLRSA